MSPASVSLDRLRDQRTWLYSRFQRDQLVFTLEGSRHLAMHDFERACQQAIDALEAVMTDVERRLAF